MQSGAIDGLTDRLTDGNIACRVGKNSLVQMSILDNITLPTLL
ncbi:hypothetical protein LYNGBM3L_28040 [Moorena producens 3L]|uniref:Uncharacterized protein n=1 Tax=Moorena producens 3L TaxID=489825 RepID=F4XP41_9CYAN|nr:hypothetical protein LYNGBM3L_28040 [Moorena producens 3L]